MLMHLHVKNLALIRETEIDFTEGLNILTGETGAGKSILIGSMTMALGGKAAREMVREDADYALVELIFTTDRPEIREKLRELDIPMEDGQIILSRKISGSRSICRLNGETVSTAVLREVSGMLIDIHGQHEHQSLLNKRKHLEILDSYAHEQLAPVLEELKKYYQLCKKLHDGLQDISLDEAERLREQSLLEFELHEIEEAGLQDGEDERLEQDYRKMVNSRRIMEALGTVRALCVGEETSASDLTGRSCRELSSVAHFDEALVPLSEQLQQIDSMLADFGRELDGYMEDLDFSGQDFMETEERLNLVNHLKSKYGSTLEEIRAYAEQQQERLDLLVHLEQRRDTLQKKYETAELQLKEYCKKAHEIRTAAAKVLEQRMQKELSELNFLDVRFGIRVDAGEKPGADGWDDVEFLISTNPGEAMKPLGKIASGGELSRVMLAIKTVLADQDSIDTVIFDEIDTGISGRTAQRVSEKLALIGRSRQVICITHLAQLAAMADSHYCIEKQAVSGETRTRIRKLSEEEVPMELARILGGAEITDAVLDNAREMKRLAMQYKGNI